MTMIGFFTICFGAAWGVKWAVSKWLDRRDTQAKTNDEIRAWANKVEARLNALERRETQ
jgi:hypothetical protein